MKESAIPKFFAKSRKERLNIVADFANLSDSELETLQKNNGGITFEDADKMVENVIGTFALPLGVATNFRVNGIDRIIPMVIEEPSVVAAASKAAKFARIKGGFTALMDESYMIGQIQVLDADISMAKKLEKFHDKILRMANSKSSTLYALNKGAKDITYRELDTSAGKMLIIELIIDTDNAMGANITNTMCEKVAPYIEEILGKKTLLKILSNYTTRRIVKTSAVFDKDAIGGKDIVEKIILAFEFANNDVYRAVTHNKGIMNGIIAVANATGQDSRAIEAAANAYAARGGTYRSLSKWSKDEDGNLVGVLEIPMSVGIVGGVANVHPVAKICNKILKVNSANELGCVMATVGLAQNFSAMRALVTEGIQRGHMQLHAKNLAAAAGAKHEKIEQIVQVMLDEDNISLERAKELVREI